MAFEQPLEADRIDDFNLFSAFVRAPLWLLGGVLGRGGSRQDEEEDPVTKRRLDSNDTENTPPSSAENSPSRKRIVSDDDLATSHRISVVSDQWQGSLIKGMGPPGLLRSKNLSWSDESGKSLVEYNDESVLHDPSPYSSVTCTTVPKQVKSALRRSRSIRSQAEGMDSSQDRTRYIPKMTAVKHGLIIPTRPFGTDVVNNGVESPQLGYGFYTNLTPPTPEMYQSHASRTAKSAMGAPPMPSHHTAGVSTAGRAHQNLVFQNLQNNKAPMGWTSVPI